MSTSVARPEKTRQGLKQIIPVGVDANGEVARPEKTRQGLKPGLSPVLKRPTQSVARPEKTRQGLKPWYPDDVYGPIWGCKA